MHLCDSIERRWQLRKNDIFVFIQSEFFLHFFSTNERDQVDKFAISNFLCIYECLISTLVKMNQIGDW